MYHQILNHTDPLADQVSAPVVVPTIASFEYESQPFRIITKDGVDLFLAKDLALILGYRNGREAVRRHVPKEDRDGVALRDAMGKRADSTRRQRIRAVCVDLRFYAAAGTKIQAVSYFRGTAGAA